MFVKTQELTLQVDLKLQSLEQMVFELSQLLSNQDAPASQRLLQVRETVQAMAALREEITTLVSSLEEATKQEVPQAVASSVSLIQQALEAEAEEQEGLCTECGEPLQFEAEVNYHLCRSCLRHLEGVFLCYECGKEVFEDAERDLRRCIDCMEAYQKAQRW